MYLERLTIKNLKLIEDLELDFRGEAGPRKWTVLLGENGTCKTTILQAIALAASGVLQANQFGVDVRSFQDRRSPDVTTKLEATFAFGTKYHEYREYPSLEGQRKPKAPPRLESRLWIEPKFNVIEGTSRFVGVEGSQDSDPLRRAWAQGRLGALAPSLYHIDPLRRARAKGLPLWFIAGYGVDRYITHPGAAPPIQNHTLERLESLFPSPERRRRIVGTGFSALLEGQSVKLANDYKEVLRSVLLGQKGLLPEITDVVFAEAGVNTTRESQREGQWFDFKPGREGIRMPATWLSQGYQGTIAWLSDLVGQILWEAGEQTTPNEMEGIVLVDELDLHLHPRWQVRLISALQHTFPHLQFIATTHSPMMLPYLKPDEIRILELNNEGSVEAKALGVSPALMTGSQMFERFFNLQERYPNELGLLLERYGDLADDPDRSLGQDRELEQIRVQLKAAGIEPGWEPVPRKMRI